MKTRVKNKRTNLGKMYFEKRYIIIESKINAKITWFIKKKGTNCGMFCIKILEVWYRLHPNLIKNKSCVIY